MKNALVSIIIPTYNRTKEFLSKAVQSVLNQTHERIELIVVDDNPASFEGSKDIQNYLKELNDDRVVYIKHSENKGANVARNTGLKVANGEYIAFLDDDDEWLDNKLEKQLGKFTNPNLGMVYCPYYVNNNGKKYMRYRKLEKGYLYEKLLLENFIGSTSCVMIKKSCLLDVGMFDENLQAAQDYELYLRISEKYSIDYVEEPLVIYYEHQGERISNNLHKKLASGKYIYNKYKEEIRKRPKVNSYKNLSFAFRYSQIGEQRLKWKHWFYAILIYPIPSKLLLKVTFRVWFKKSKI